MSTPLRVALLGGGEIGAGWAALFAAHGAHVRIVDPDADALDRAKAELACARRLGVGGSSAAGVLEQRVDALDAVRDADWVQESLPEIEELKRSALRAISPAVAEYAVVASSTSFISPDTLAAGLPFANRFLIAHPLHPVYAVPVVELAPSRFTSESALDQAANVLRTAGREPVIVRGDVPGLVANRLTAALLREAMDLVARGAVTAEELDTIVARGIATGWVTAGALGTEAVAAGGGTTGFALFLQRLGAPMERVWRTLARWERLGPTERAAVLESYDAGARKHSTHLAGCGWAESIARIEHDARS